ILRAPGIYAQTRLPLDRIRQGTPVLTADDDVFTNHIHADDLARAAVAALFRGRPNRAYNVTDDAQLKMGGWFDAIADAYALPRPPRVTWEEAEQRIAPMLLSFMSESRRLANARMKRELRVRLRYPSPAAMLAEVAPRDLKKQLALAL
ncbi:MAG TPA: SDR family NAD(P)-dependent oxidoreductase, partial [Casimicrobiaceae bacterium]|nr:SDR family NAD(P)-dependent oxidoreductase [Casimicrobiaceae bacterium]